MINSIMKSAVIILCISVCCVYMLPTKHECLNEYQREVEQPDENEIHIKETSIAKESSNRTEAEEPSNNEVHIKEAPIVKESSNGTKGEEPSENEVQIKETPIVKESSSKRTNFSSQSLLDVKENGDCPVGQQKDYIGQCRTVEN